MGEEFAEDGFHLQALLPGLGECVCISGHGCA